MNKTKAFSAKKLLASALASAMLFSTAVSGASACTTIYVGGALTEEGTPFVARTEDYGSNMNKLWFVSDAGAFPKGTTYYGCPHYGEFEWTFTHDSYKFTHFTNDVFHGACPECGKTYQVGDAKFHFSYTEFGTNEMGVSVSATETIYGNSKVKKADPLVKEKVDGKVGIEETDIPTVILAEAASAREGVDLLCDIYDNYGAYYESGVFICDRNEAWYIENCSGHQYIALKLTDDMIFLEPNMSVIGLIDLGDTENVIASENLIKVAQDAGTFVGDADKNIIDYRASYANIDRSMDRRMVQGLNYLNSGYNYNRDTLEDDNTLFTISNVKDDEIVPIYTNITASKSKLDKNDVFGYYKLSTIGGSTNQEIEIFQLFNESDYSNRDLTSATVGWVGVGDMSNNVFIPYYPMLLNDSDDIYEGYQKSLAAAEFVEGEKPDGKFALPAVVYDDDYNMKEGYTVYPDGWEDSYYFTFEALGGYIRNAETLEGAPLKDTDKQYIRNELQALQDEFNETFEKMAPSDTAATGKAMAQKAHEKGRELLSYAMNSYYKYVVAVQAPETLKRGTQGTASVQVYGGSKVDACENALLKVTVTGPEGSNPQVLATVHDAEQGADVDVNVAETGVLGSEEGFAVNAEYDVTTSLKLTFDVAGQYTITFTLVDASGEGGEETVLATGSASVTVSNPSSSGGSSSGGGSSSNTTTTTTKNPDGSTTTTKEDKKTGTVTETTKNPDGSQTVVETKKDGTVTTTDKTADGSTGTVTVNADGSTEAQVKLTSKAVSDAADAPVSLPMAEVEATRSTETAPTVTISTGSSTPVKVEIPVADVTPGTVAVIVNPDGTEEIVKTSVPTEDGIVLEVANGAVVKLVDNSTSFSDVSSSHWANDAVDFVTARELFSGTSAGSFSPDSAMTRAMLMTVLARFDGADTNVTDGSAWYAKSMEWAVANGVSDGSNPEGNITREQLVTMLWRYAGSPAAEGSVSGYSDGGSVSSYAADAMTWAIQQGLISGMGNNTLAPQGNATRAQLAQILTNFVKL